jgi:hypothetical protein
MIKTHADFKRALSTQGTRLTTLALVHGGVEGRIKIGATRHIRKADTTGVYLVTDEELDKPTNGSFLGFDKASDWTFNGDIATHTLGMSYQVLRASSE